MAKKGYIEENTDIGKLVRKAEDDFNNGTTHVSKYVDFSLSEDINRIYAYLESKHISGDTDSQGREKPFFNIVLAARNIWFRATDIDRSNIKIRSTKSTDDIGTFLATIHLQEWMRRESFGVFLNSWGINSAGFNESVLKFVEQKGRLIPSVVPWNRIIVDSVDFQNNPKIEILELTEAQLRKNKAYDQEIVDKLCDALVARETVEKQKKDNKNSYIKLYEVHGELPLSYLTGNAEDCDEYVQQMHVITFVAGKGEGDFDDYTLYSGKEAKDPYMLAALLPEVDGSIALRGAVKVLFDSQWMQNHSAKLVKDQLDLAALIVFQTSDPTFVAQNFLASMQNGDILIHKVNEPLTQLNNGTHDITASQNFAVSWKQLGNELTGISESMLGANPPSGTAWRQTEALLNESHSLFDIMTENRGLDVERMLRTYIIPFLKKQMDTTKEVAATLDAHQITKIDAMYLKNKSIQHANKMVHEDILNGDVPSPDQQMGYAQQQHDVLKEGLAMQGNQRYFKPSELDDTTWKQLFKDIEWDVECDVTNENVDKDAMTTLNTLFGIVTDPNRAQALETPKGKFLFNKILERTGTVSTLELNGVPEAPPAQPQQDPNAVPYAGAPEDVKRQLEAQSGLTPSAITPPPPVPEGATPM